MNAPPDRPLAPSGDRSFLLQADSSEVHYRTMAESIPEIMWISSPEGEVEYLNRRFYEFTGATPGGDPTAGWQEALHPDDLGPCLARWLSCRERREPFEMEYRLRRRDGEYLWHLGRACTARGAGGRVVKWFGAATNIHGQKLAEQRAQGARIAAEAAQERLVFLAEASVRLASSLDYDTTVRSVAQLAVPQLADWCAVDVLEEGRLRSVAVAHADPAKVAWARELVARYPVDLAAPRGVPHVLRSGEPEFYPEIPEELLLGAAASDEHRDLLRRIGLSSVIIAPLSARGRTFGALSLVSAESGRRYGEDDLRLAEDLATRVALAIDNARLYRDAQEAIRVRESFLTIASHELKTPLTAMHLQFVSIQRALQQGGELPREKLADRVQGATRQVERLDRLINDLLDVSRIRGAGISISREQVDLVELAREVLGRFEGELTRAGCDARVVADGPVEGRWDRLRLDQVLTNLVGNAIKYGRGRPVEVSLRTEGERLRLAVRDQGIGIPREHQARIFQRFERAVSDRNYGGFGIGLWIVKQLTEAMGGTILVDSEPGAGATFVIDLPRAPEALPKEPELA